MRKLRLNAVVLWCATAGHGGLADPAANTEVRAPEASLPSSAQRRDGSGLAARREGMAQQKMMMQKQMMMRKQMAMQREMQRHPIRTRLHFALLNFKRKLHYAFH